MDESISESQQHTRQVLAWRAQQLAVPPAVEARSGEMLELAVFQRAGDTLGLPTRLVQEIQPLCNLHWTLVPGAPAYIGGAVNLRGHIYSIVDLPAFWGRSTDPLSTKSAQEKTHLLLVRGGQSSFATTLELALLADGVPSVLTSPVSEILPPPITISSRLQDYLTGVTNEMLLILDIERLLLDPRLIVEEE